MSIKAYNLIPVLEKTRIFRDKSRTEILCIDCCGKNLYIGTDDCFIIHFLLEEKVFDNGRPFFNCEKQEHKSSLSESKKAVTQIKAASAHNRLLYLSESVLQLLNMFDLEPVSSGAKMKGVTQFSLNENPLNDSPFSIEVCIALKKKCIQIVTIKDDRMILNRELSVADIPVAVSIDSGRVCMALVSEYKMWDIETGHVQELFPFDADQLTPIITKISKEEVLLSAPGSLGMFANAIGMSERPPLQWNRSLISVAYCHPYILAVNDEFITVHSILDQQQKQSFPFQGGQYMGDFEGRILIASKRDIYALIAVPLEKQIQELLSNGRVTESLQLAKNARKTGMSKEAFAKMYKRIQQQAGFVEFSTGHFEEARELFLSGCLDLRELISLYSGLLPSASSFTRSMPQLHEIPDVSHLTKGDERKSLLYNRFLLDLLMERSADITDELYRKDVHTALLKLCALLKPEKLVPFIEMFISCDTKDTADWMAKFGFFHAQALLLRCHGQLDLAFQKWKQLTDNQLTDPAFPGFDFVVQCFCLCENVDLVWKYSDWLMNTNKTVGVKIFTERASRLTQQFDSDSVITYLTKFGSAPLILYLENLVNNQDVRKEKYHTHLALLYLDNVFTAKSANDKVSIDIARSKLQTFLQNSNHYLTSQLLAKVKDTDLFKETAILHGKAGDYEAALRILVHRLQDLSGAEEFCHRQSQNADPAYKRRIFQTLLEVYLDPKSTNPEELMSAAISLLNSEFVDVDCSKVIRLLPSNWAVGIVKPFLTKSVMVSSQRCRETKVLKSLTKAENLRLQEVNLLAKKNSVLLLEDRECAVCGGIFTDPACARYPNGTVVHIKCAKQHFICPVTGKLFSSTSAAGRSAINSENR